MKQQCGEPTNALTFEKFKGTLQRNKDALVAAPQLLAGSLHGLREGRQGGAQGVPGEMRPGGGIAARRGTGSDDEDPAGCRGRRVRCDGDRRRRARVVGARLARHQACSSSAAGARGSRARTIRSPPTYNPAGLARAAEPAPTAAFTSSSWPSASRRLGPDGTPRSRRAPRRRSRRPGSDGGPRPREVCAEGGLFPNPQLAATLRLSDALAPRRRGARPARRRRDRQGPESLRLHAPELRRHDAAVARSGTCSRRSTP